jgi:plastocyanin
MKKLALVLAMLALASVGFAACGDDDDDDTASETTATTTTEAGGGGGGGGGAGGGGTVAVSANPDGGLEFEQTELTAPAGEVTIEFDNPASLDHDVVVEDDSGAELARTDVISEDTTSTSAQFDAGSYTFYCSVDGHRAAGMEGTLTVE